MTHQTGAGDNRRCATCFFLCIKQGHCMTTKVGDPGGRGIRERGRDTFIVGWGERTRTIIIIKDSRLLSYFAGLFFPSTCIPHMRPRDRDVVLKRVRGGDALDFSWRVE